MFPLECPIGEYYVAIKLPYVVKTVRNTQVYRLGKIQSGDVEHGGTKHYPLGFYYSFHSSTIITKLTRKLYNSYFHFRKMSSYNKPTRCTIFLLYFVTTPLHVSGSF
jgi:hypothetical protein